MSSLTKDDTIIIVGAGQAGGEAAVTLRRKGFEGRVVMIGDEPYVPYERPPLSKGYLSGALEQERLFLKKPEFYAEKNIELMLGRRVIKIDRAAKKVLLDKDQEIGYSKLLIATGGRARKLPIAGAELNGVLYLRNMDDIHAIQAAIKPGVRAVMIGGGYIGLETAAVLRGKFECPVTLLEMEPRLLSRVAAPIMGEYYERVHRSHGVDIRLNAQVAEIVGDGTKVTGVKCKDGEVIPADFVIVGIGIIPNTEIATEAGLEIKNGSVVVNEFAQTSDADITAAGDMTWHPNSLMGRELRLESVPNAVSQGKTAAQTMLGELIEYSELPWFWSDQYDLKLQMAGINNPGDDIVIRGNMDENKFTAFYLRDGVVVAVNIINDLKNFMPGKKLVQNKAVVDPAKLADESIALKDLS
jgi:3-phenylpropionate/trans-cinnamate dioxygenase ferredoxin reductase subunit